MKMSDTVRLDKYIWAIRCFKTRSEASEACNGNKVRLNGVVAKPSKQVKVGDTVEVHKGVAQFTYKVLKLTENRLGASLVPDVAENLTPQEELDKLRAPVETFFVRRERGAGRPTKKDRRTLDALWDSFEDE